MHQRYDWIEAENVLVTELFNSGKSHDEIAKVLGMSASSITKRCGRLGLHRRGPYRQHKVAAIIEPLEIIPLSERLPRIQAWVREILAR